MILVLIGISIMSEVQIKELHLFNALVFIIIILPSSQCLLHHAVFTSSAERWREGRELWRRILK